MEVKARTCPVCGSGDVHRGKVTGDGSYITAFIPDVTSWISYSPTLRMQAVVCMSCGFVGQHLNEEALARIRHKKA